MLTSEGVSPSMLTSGGPRPKRADKPPSGVLDRKVYREFVALLEFAGDDELIEDGFVGLGVGVGGWHGRADYGVQVAGACVADLCLDAAVGRAS